jgi:molybdate transport system substrate-binding protein
VIAGVALLVAGCSSSSGSGESSAKGASANVVTVSTPSNLRPLVDQLALSFQSANPALRALPRTDATSEARAAAVQTRSAQIVIGPSAVALGSKVIPLTNATPGTTSRPVAKTAMAIAVPAANPGKVTGLSAFAAGTPLRTQICAGPRLIATLLLYVLRGADVQPSVATMSEDPTCVTVAVASLAGGRLDAALVPRSGLAVPPGLRFVSIPTDHNLMFEFGATKVASSPAADAFEDFLGSDAAKEVLTRNGYLP